MLMKKKQSEESMVMKKQSGRGEEGRFVMKTQSGGMVIDVRRSKEDALLEWIEETLDSREFQITGSLFMLLTEMVAGDESTILTIISLLDSSPFLENLREYHLPHRAKNDDDFSPCVHWRLKTVTIDCYAGPDGKDNPLYAAIVLWLSRIVLERAPALEKMSIVVKNYGDT